MKKREIRTALVTIGVTAAALLGAVDSARAQQNTSWNVSWARSPIKEAVNADGTDANFTLSNQTIRQIVHTSIGGSIARIHLANLYGTAPLVISDVHLALSANNQGPATVAGTDVAVTFSGQTSVTIPVGAAIVSDTINFAVPVQGDVAISLYSPSATPIVNLTAHDFSSERNYYVAGDESAASNFAVLGTELRYVFLTGFDVQQPAASGTVVAFGASITDGFDSNIFQNHRWPDVLEQRLTAAGLTLGMADEGLPGGGITGGPGQFGPGATERYKQDALSQAGAHWIIFSDFVINDLDFNPATPAATEISALQSFISQAHSAGFLFVCSTLTPFGGRNAKWTQEGETTREQYNTFVHTAGNGCDEVFDQAAAVEDPTNSVQIAPPWGKPDGIHPSDVGDQILANAINIAIFGQLPTGTPLIANGTYMLVVRNSGEGSSPLVLDDPALSTANGTVMQIYTMNEGKNQQWKLTNIGNNIVSLINVTSGKALEVAGGSMVNGATVDQSAYTGSSAQQWQIVSAGNGWFELLNVNSGQSLDVTAGSATAGATVVQWPYHSVTWEQWTFVH
jgi:lysophospholipase L1-like esterase